MKFIYRLRQFGKTTELLNIALDLAEQGKEVVFVSPTVAMAKYAQRCLKRC
jgi:reverse gyrase